MTTSYNAGLDTSNVKMSYAVESVWATIPVVVFQQIRLTGEDFTETKTRVRPLEINPSGYAQHAITTKVESKGSFNFALSFQTFDDFILGALNATAWSNFGQVANTGLTAALAVVSGSHEITATTGYFTTPGVGQVVLHPGDTITTAGFTNAANNGKFTVHAATNGTPDTMTLYNYGTAVAATLVTETAPAGATVTLNGIQCVAGTVTLTTATNILSSTNHDFAGIVAGQWIMLAGFTNAVNNGAFKVVTFTDDEHIVIENSTNTQVFVTETPAGSVQITGSFIQNGANVTTYSFEKQLAPALFLQYVGSYVSDMKLSMDVGKFVEGTFTFLVKSQVSATAEAGTSTPTAAPLGRVIDNISGFSAFNVNGTAPSAVLQQVEMTVSKQRSASQYGIGSAAAVGMRRGTLQVDGKLSLFFKDFTYYNDFVNETDLGVSWQLTDSTGNAYVITLPAITVMNPSIVAKGIDQDIIADFTMEGNPAASTNTYYPFVTIQIDRLPVTL